MLQKLLIKKDYLLVITVAILILISYNFAFKQTYAAWRINRQLSTQLQQNTDVSYQPQYLERKITNLNKVLDLYNADTISYRNNSISAISILAEKEDVKLREVPLQDPFYRNDNYIIQKIYFEGNFFNLSKVLFQLQQTANIGIIRSLSYRLDNERSNIPDKKKIILEVYLEILK